MKTIRSYLRAAKSLGANDWTAFWRVYFPQSIPGVGAGSHPRLHPRDRLLHHALSWSAAPPASSSRTGSPIATPTSLNWGLAAALATLLLLVVLALYPPTTGIVGIDNVKLG